MSTGKLYFKVKWYAFKELLWTFRNSPASFSLFSLVFHFLYLFVNPYRVSRKFLKKEIYRYGETPLFSFSKIKDLAQISGEDVFFDLGAGRGRGCFWLHYTTGCQVIGIERVKLFVFLANILKKIFRLKAVSFLNMDILKANLEKATIIYIYEYSLPDEIVDLIPSSARVVTVSEPLGSSFKVIKSVMISFPWGETEAFLQEKVGS